MARYVADRRGKADGASPGVLGWGGLGWVLADKARSGLSCSGPGLERCGRYGEEWFVLLCQGSFRFGKADETRHVQSGNGEIG